MKQTYSLNRNNIIPQDLSHLNLSLSDIKNYTRAYNKITNSLGCDKYTLTEGITNNKYKYKNILVDLYHQTIPSEIINRYPISIVFNIKKDKHNNIKTLTKVDIKNYKKSNQIGMDFFGEISSSNYFYIYHISNIQHYNLFHI